MHKWTALLRSAFVGMALGAGLLALAAGLGAGRLSDSAFAAQTTRPAAAAAPAQQPERPNILLYVIDTLRADELGCYGAQVTKTPEFDRLAAEGAAFLHVSALASATRPSMASLITGVPGEVHGAQKGGESLLKSSSSLVRVPELLQQQGYYTGAVIANPNLSPVFGFGIGFDVFQEAFANKSDTKSLDEERGLISDAAIMVEKTRQFIESAPSDKPYFLWVMTIDPHDPYTPPAPFETMYDKEVSGERDGSLEALNAVHRRIRKGEKPDLTKARALYRGEVSYADRHLGELVKWLRGTARLDKTLVVVTADHGEEFLEHGDRGHGKSVYEEVTHVPLIARYPGYFKAGTRRDEPADLLDLSATLAAVGGAKRPAFWHGRDLRKPLAARPIFTSQRRPPSYFTTVRENGHKLVRDDSRGKTEIFDLREDPGEQRPLSGDAARQQLASLSPKLDDYRRVTSALRQSVNAGESELNTNELPEDVVRALKALGYVE